MTATRADASHPLLPLLKRRFGYAAFRPGQEAIIDNALAGNHGLVIMPTGGGKSLCYQLPALAGGVTLVVSPLIALMKDQVDALRANAIPAAFINSALDNDQIAAVERLTRAGQVNILYVAPERATQASFQRFLGHLDLRLIAIDEAHCISEWGHDFRPDYRALSILRQRFPHTPVMALTATATQRVRQDIIAQLNLGDCPQFVSSFDRANLTYIVRPRDHAAESLLALFADRPGQSAIVYCFSRRETEEVAELLNDHGRRALPYHAGLDPDTRRRTQERFIDGEVPIITATIAFGMGIDKPDIRLVVHYTLPKSVAGYYQETGRAGRDGLPSDCVLFFSEADRFKHEYFINQMSDDHAQTIARTQLDDIVAYGRLGSCRRRYLLEYFGETTDSPSCGNCDACQTPRQSVDATVIAQKMLSAVIRTGERFGIAHINNVLLGSRSQRIRDLGHHQLSVFGIVIDYDRPALRAIADSLAREGLLARSADQYATVSVTPAGRQWLSSRQQLTLELPVSEPVGNQAEFLPRHPERPPASRAGGNASPGRATDYDEVLFADLRALRRRLADAQNVPAFVVFNDDTLRALARRRPADPQEMLGVSGVGPAKLARYGDAFLKAISEHRPAAA